MSLTVHSARVATEAGCLPRGCYRPNKPTAHCGQAACLHRRGVPARALKRWSMPRPRTTTTVLGGTVSAFLCFLLQYVETGPVLDLSGNTVGVTIEKYLPLGVSQELLSDPI